MKLRLVSEDKTLLATCQEVLADFEDSGWELDQAAPGEVSHADFCIWDYRPGMAIPQDADWEARHVFLVSRGDLQAFSETAVPGANILIKPVTRPALAAFFARKATIFCDKGTPVDELLQSFIEVNGRLQESDSARTNFLTRAVHDCLTPVTTISGYSRLLCLPQFGSITERQAEVLSRIQHSAERLSRLMSAVLQLAVKNSASPPVRKTGDIRQCINEAVRELLPFAKEKLITFDVDCQGAPETLLFDRVEVEQVLGDSLVGLRCVNQWLAVSVDASPEQVVGCQFGGGDDVDGAAEQGTKLLVESEDVDDRRAGVELDQDVEVRVGPIVGDRAEDPGLGERVVGE